MCVFLSRIWMKSLIFGYQIPLCTHNAPPLSQNEFSVSLTKLCLGLVRLRWVQNRKKKAFELFTSVPFYLILCRLPPPLTNLHQLCLVSVFWHHLFFPCVCLPSGPQVLTNPYRPFTLPPSLPQFLVILSLFNHKLNTDPLPPQQTPSPFPQPSQTLCREEVLCCCGYNNTAQRILCTLEG